MTLHPEERQSIFMLLAGIGMVAMVVLIVLTVSASDETLNLDTNEPVPWEEQAFTGEVVGDALYPPVAGIDEAGRVLDALVLDPELVWEGTPEVTGEDQLRPDLVRIEGTIEGTTVEAFALKIPGPSRCGALIIPGSDPNQGASIVAGDGYHGTIGHTVAEQCDTYVQVKPNESVRAIHNGKAKLAPEFVYMHLLNRGGSYAARYLVEARLLLTWLDEAFPSVGVVGLSQGGAAALDVALATPPDWAVVSSAFATSFFDIYPGGLDQEIVPGLTERYDEQGEADALAASPVRWLFTWGKAETTIYGEEARNGGPSCGWLQDTGADITCVFHEGGHAFPEAEVAAFVDQTVRQ